MSELTNPQKVFLVFICLLFVWWVVDCWRKGKYDDSSDDDYFDGEP